MPDRCIYTWTLYIHVNFHVINSDFIQIVYHERINILTVEDPKQLSHSMSL